MMGNQPRPAGMPAMYANQMSSAPSSMPGMSSQGMNPMYGQQQPGQMYGAPALQNQHSSTSQNVNEAPTSMGSMYGGQYLGQGPQGQPYQMGYQYSQAAAG